MLGGWGYCSLALNHQYIQGKTCITIKSFTQCKLRYCSHNKSVYAHDLGLDNNNFTPDTLKMFSTYQDIDLKACGDWIFLMQYDITYWWSLYTICWCNHDPTWDRYNQKIVIKKVGLVSILGKFVLCIKPYNFQIKTVLSISTLLDCCFKCSNLAKYQGYVLTKRSAKYFTQTNEEFTCNSAALDMPYSI